MTINALFSDDMDYNNLQPANYLATAYEAGTHETEKSCFYYIMWVCFKSVERNFSTP